MRVTVEPGHFYIVTKKLVKIDLGNIDSIKSEYIAKANSPKAIISQPLENAFAYDTGVSHKVSVSFTRGQSAVAQNERNEFSNDTIPGDSSLWTNGYFSYIIYLLINRWQMSTDGIWICYCPTDGENGAGDLGKTIGRVISKAEGGNKVVMDCLNAYISSYSPSYTTSNFNSYHASLTFSIGSITMTTVFEGYTVRYSSSFGEPYEETAIVRVFDDDATSYELIGSPKRWEDYSGKEVIKWTLTKNGETITFDKDAKIGQEYFDVYATDGRFEFKAIMRDKS